MSADLSFLWFPTAFGLIAAVFLLFSRWPGWVGFPLSILAIRFGVDAGLSPLLRYQFGIGQLKVEDATIVRPPGPEEIGGAVFTLVLGYGCIALGMLMVRAFARRVVPAASHPQQASLETARRGYRAATWVFMFGLFINIVTVAMAGSGLDDLGEIASSRAAFTNEAAYSSAWFNYAWVLRTCMQIGAIAMLIFAYRMRRNIPLSWAANALYFAVQAIYGGRTTIVVGGLVLAIVYHHGIRKIRSLSLLVIVGLVISALSYIATVRHGAGSVPQAMVMSVAQMASGRAMEEVAFARRDFPDRMPYFYGSTIASGLSMALPGTDIGKNLWRTIEMEYLGPNYKRFGIGGQTISTTGESYMNFGFPGVILVALMAGLVFGSVYEWQRRNPTNPFAVLLAALITAVFIVAIYKKLGTRLSDIPMRMLVPLGFIAAYAAGGRYLRTWTTMVAFVLVGLVLFRFLRADLIKYLTLVVIVSLYYYSVVVQVAFTRVENYRQMMSARRSGADSGEDGKDEEDESDRGSTDLPVNRPVQRG